MGRRGEKQESVSKKEVKVRGAMKEERCFHSNLAFLYLGQKYSPSKITCSSSFNGDF